MPLCLVITAPILSAYCRYNCTVASQQFTGAVSMFALLIRMVLSLGWHIKGGWERLSPHTGKFVSLKIAYSSVFCMHNACNSRILSP